MPKLLFSWKPHPFCGCSCSNNEAICCKLFISYSNFKWRTTKIYGINSFCDNFCSGIERLLPHMHHELTSINPLRESREVFYHRCSGELSTSSNSSCHKSFKHEWLQKCLPSINSSSMSRRTRTNNNYFTMHFTFYLNKNLTGQGIKISIPLSSTTHQSKKICFLASKNSSNLLLTRYLFS